MAVKGTILVTGATGKQGGAVTRELLPRGHTVRAMTRKPDSPAAQELSQLGAEVVQGDLDDAASLERVLEGVWGVLGIQNTWEAGVEREEEQGKRLATLAREAGVEHFVYHSVGSADRSTGIPHFDNKARIEETVKSLGFPSHTILRPVFFMENLAGPPFRTGIAEGTLAIGMKPETRLQMIAVRDIGFFGLRAFEDHETLNRREIDLAGDALTGPEMAQVLSEVSEQEVSFVQIPIEQVREASEDYAAMLEWFDAVGYDADVSALEKEFGHQMTRFREWAADQDWTG